MTKLLIEKYTPLFFEDFDINRETIEIIKNMLVLSNNVNILLYGPSGSGKTAILNAIINEYYKGISSSENDILKITNLKEQGINYYKTDIKIFCQSCSSIKNKKKILVLDDIDSITEQNQQTFRNFIDKYRNNVFFIASCSNIQKVIENIQSRLNTLSIYRFSYQDIEQIFNKIVNEEKICITAEAKNFILKISNNSFKTMLNYIEKCKLYNETIDIDTAKYICSYINIHILDEYVVKLKNQDLQQAIKILYEIYDNGYSVIDILDILFSYVKHTSILTDDEKYKFVPYLCKYMTIFYNINENEIELAFITGELINGLKEINTENLNEKH